MEIMLWRNRLLLIGSFVLRIGSEKGDYFTKKATS